MKKIKILMVAGNMHVGGLENQLMHLLRNIDRERFQIDFTSNMSDAYYKTEIEKLGSQFIVLPAYFRQNPWKYCTYLYKLMKRGKYDVVHSHELFHSGITLTIARFAGVPCRFVHAHSWRECAPNGKYTIGRKFYHTIMRALINQNSTVQIGCSTWAGKFLYGSRMMCKQTYYTIYNSVETRKFLDKYDEVETGEYCEQDGWKNVINVARIVPVKNQLFLVEVARELQRRNSKVRILCVGNGDISEIDKVQCLIDEYGLEEYLILTGVRSDIDSLMRKSSAFVLTSKFEGMPLVMIEAQASGLPCVTADTYSHEVDFGLGNVTWISLDASVATWADALERAVTVGRAEKQNIIKAIKENKFDSKLFAETLSDLYERDYNCRKKHQ